VRVPFPIGRHGNEGAGEVGGGEAFDADGVESCPKAAGEFRVTIVDTAVDQSNQHAIIARLVRQRPIVRAYGILQTPLRFERVSQTDVP